MQRLGFSASVAEYGAGVRAQPRHDGRRQPACCDHCARRRQRVPRLRGVDSRAAAVAAEPPALAPTTAYQHLFVHIFVLHSCAIELRAWFYRQKRQRHRHCRCSPPFWLLQVRCLVAEYPSRISPEYSRVASFSLSPLIAAAALVYPEPPLLLSQLPFSVPRYTRSVIIGEVDTGATGARSGLSTLSLHSGLIFFFFVVLAEWDTLGTLPPPPLVVSVVPEAAESDNCEPHWEFGCVGGVRYHKLVCISLFDLRSGVQIVIAAEAIEYVATALKKMHDVAGNNSSIKIVECLSHIHGSGTCHGLRFIGDIVKASRSCEEGGWDAMVLSFSPSHETDRRVEQDRACPFHGTCNLYHCQFTHLIQLA